MMSAIFEVVEHSVPGSHIRQYARSTSTEQEEVLHLAVKQYKPFYDVRKGDVTIIACHANAFPKELYEPIWEDLFKHAERKPAGSRIRAIWIWDFVNSGDSGVLNEGKLGDELSWYDHVRDGLALVNHFRSEMIRPIMGFGHSMGGNIIINLALLHPRLLTSIATIEPTLNKTPSEMNLTAILPITTKADKWPSKNAAESALRSIPPYKRWDPRVFSLFTEHGLRQLPTAAYPADEGVTLKTSKHQEVFSFARPAFPPSRTQDLAAFRPDRIKYPDMGVDRAATHAFYRPESTITFAQLPFLRPSCLYVHGDRSHMYGAKPRGRADKIQVTGVGVGGSGGAAEGRVKDVVIKGSHFVPFETPAVIASVLVDWFDAEHEIWAKREAEDMESWGKIPHGERSKVNGDVLFWAEKTVGAIQPRKSKM